MATAMVWITTIISSVIIFIAGHIAITIILPKLRDLLNPIIKDEKAISSLMTLLMILVVVLAFTSMIIVLGTLQNEVLNLLNVFRPGLELLTSLGKYIGYLVMGLLVVLGLKYYK